MHSPTQPERASWYKDYWSHATHEPRNCFSRPRTIPTRCVVPRQNSIRAQDSESELESLLCSGSMNRAKSLDDQILPLVLSFAIQINISSPTRDHLSPKAAGNTRSYVYETPTAVLRQILLQHHDQCFRLLEGDAAGHQAGNSHPVAPAKLQIVLEMEEPIRSGQTEDPTGPNRPDQTDGKRESSLGRTPDSRRVAQARV